MNQYEKRVRTEVESIDHTEYYTEFEDAFLGVREWAEEKDFEEYKILAQYEIDICSLRTISIPIIVKEKNERFVPKITFKNGEECPNRRKFTQDQFDYYEKRLLETTNIFLRYRYSDFLYETSSNASLGKYQISQHLIESSESLVNYYHANGSEIQYLSVLARIIEVSLLMNSEESLLKGKALLLKKIYELERENHYQCIPTYSVLLREILSSNFSTLVSKEEQSLIIDMLCKTKEYFLNLKDYDLHKNVCEELIEYEKYGLITQDDRSSLNLEIGKGYELQAIYQGGRENTSLITKAHYYGEALKHYREIGEKDKIDEMKIKIKKNYEELETSDEMQLIETPISIPKEVINNKVDSFIGQDIQESLDRIATIPLITSVANTKELVHETYENSVFLNLVSKSTISNGKKIEHSDSTEDSFLSDFNRSYMLNVDLGTGIILKGVFEKLIDVYNLNTDDIMERFEKWNHLDKRNHPFIKRGLIKFFEGDYISSIHILVPQFESTLRNFFKQAGYATTSIKKGGTQQDQTFNAFLDREDIKSALSDDDYTLIRVIMVEQTGLNLRNNIAHGTIGLNDVTQNRCIIVIYLYLILTGYQIEEVELNE